MAIPGGYDETLAQMAQEMADLQKRLNLSEQKVRQMAQENADLQKKVNLLEQKVRQMQDIIGGEKKAAPKKKA